MKQAAKMVRLGVVLVLTACGGAEEAPEAPLEEAPAAPAPAPSDALVDPNTAPAAQLVTVDGIDSTTAARIEAGRPYADMVAVDAAIGAADDTERDRIFTRLWMPIDLNTASDEEIMLIPGVGEQMAHEFEEYRPYDSIERFRREIGKYVDSTEVARLEKYVTIR